jgi:SAM-dependent methyltransferase
VKVRESGMPAEGYWRAFFHPQSVLEQLDLTPNAGDVAEFGCGYGTFTIAAAGITRGLVHAIDIDPEMVAAATRNVEAAGLQNVRLHCRDFVREGSGLADVSCGYAMLFNILHAEEPLLLLREAFRVLTPGGRLGILHWNYDPATPRGPSMEIRPRPEQCAAWAAEAGFSISPPDIRSVGQYHYGIVAIRAAVP